MLRAAIFYLFFSTFIFAWGTALGTFWNPDSPAAMFDVILVVAPLLYLGRPLLPMCVSSVGFIVFLLFAYFIKDPVVFLTDVVNSCCSYVISIFFCGYMTSLRLSNLQARSLFQSLAETDRLTGTMSKISAEDRCAMYLDAAGTNAHCALLVFDIDNFKAINDTLGHNQGDEVLRVFGAKLHGLFRENDIVGRIGGDEFIVLMRDLADEQVIRRKAEEILQQVGDIFGDLLVDKLSCSVGIAICSGETLTYPQLFYRADKALYLAKSQGMGRCVLFSEGGNAPAARPMLLIADPSDVSRTLLSTYFKDDFRLLEAPDGTEALRLLHKYGNQLGLLLLNAELPNVSGLEILRDLKDSPVLADIPTVIITSNPATKDRAMQLGAADLLEKPFDPDTVRSRVRRAYALRR